jgi:hypothetical protein
LASHSPSPSIAIAPVEDPACERVEFPSVRSVIVVPGEVLGRAMAPVVRAACACSRSGATVRLTTVIVPEDGTVTATVAGDERVDACLQQRLVGRFEPFALGTDCIECGPKRYGVFRGADPPERKASRITYPFALIHP